MNKIEKAKSALLDNARIIHNLKEELEDARWEHNELTVRYKYLLRRDAGNLQEEIKDFEREFEMSINDSHDHYFETVALFTLLEHDSSWEKEIIDYLIKEGQNIPERDMDMYKEQLDDILNDTLIS